MKYVTLGKNVYHGRTNPIVYKDEDRLRHMYMIGKTGVGKSTIFQNMCLQDIQNGHGTCFIDPHGESVEWLMERIPQNRVEDVIIFDPSNTENPHGLNLLDAKSLAETDFLVAQTIEIFYKLFDPEKTGIIGPQFEHWLRNSALTVMSGPEGGSLLEIPKLFVDKRFELQKRQHLKDPIVLEFWTKQMSKTSDFHRSEMLNYFSSKFGHFLNNSIMRNIIGQRKSSFAFDDVLAGEKILLVNLSKGKIGDLNAQMLGLILVSKLQAAILKRANLNEEDRYPFYLYVDEFQNMTTDTFTGMLSESRKYGLGVHLTNQYFAQLPKKIQDSILGNVGTMVSFEIGTEDAEIMCREFDGIDKEDFLHLPRFHFYIKLMINGKTSDAFSGVSLPPYKTNSLANTSHIRAINNLAYGKPKSLVEAQIMHNLK